MGEVKEENSKELREILDKLSKVIKCGEIKKITKFGNADHIIISKKYRGNKAIVLILQEE